MYLHPITHKDKYAKIIALQQRGWLMESHCWVDEGGWPRTCKWCGAVADRDMHIKGGRDITLCPDNPDIKALVEAIQGLADVLRQRDPDKSHICIEMARTVLQRHGADL